MQLDTEACESVSVWPLEAALQGQISEMMYVCRERGIHILSGQDGSQILPFLSLSDCGEFSWLFNVICTAEQVLMYLPGKEGGWEGGCGKRSLFQLLVNLLLPFPGLGVKCINILHEGWVGVEALLFSRGTSYLFLF